MTDRVLQTMRGARLLFVVSGCILCLLILLSPHQALAEDEIPDDEVSVFFNVSGLGGKELEAIIKGEQLYPSVTDLFEYLKINHQISEDHESVRGFFIVESSRYVIDQTKKQVILGEKTYPLNREDFIQTSSGLYLRSEVFGKVFGLECAFNFRNLSVTLNTKLDLPVIREKRQEMMRTNLSKLKREIQADTTIRQNYPALSFGNFDWAVTSTQQNKSVQDTRLSLRIGSIIAGGETNFALNYNSRQDFNLRQQHYLWRYVNNDQKALRQVKVGKIPVQSTVSLYAPVIGLQFSNIPTTYRRSFGSYTLSDFTEPEWVVELYINNVLVDYVKADASGFFTFKVPMIYGNTAVKLRFFGPWGEERFKEQNINVPYNFLPKNEMEYNFSAGMLEDGHETRFSRLDLKYGLSNRLTIGSGVEYLSALNAGQIMPFINVSYRMTSNLLLSGDYTLGVRRKALLNYRMPGDLMLELNYTKYQRGQQAISQTYLEEAKAMVSRPFRSQNIYGFSRLSATHLVYAKTRQTTADLLLSATSNKISVNLSTYAQMINTDYLNVYSKLALACKLPSNINFRPQIQYGYKFQRIDEFRAEMEKQVLGRGFLNVSYQNNFNTNTQSVSLGLRLDFSFARASFSARQSHNRAVFTQTLTGGGLVDAKTKYFNLNKRSNVGQGGLVISPFLDLNLNNRRDQDEPKVQGLDFRINGGRIQNNIRDTSIQVFDLEPYNSYLLELSPSSFDNIAWQLKNRNYKIAIEPNKLKLIEVPVRVSGEASGMIHGTDSDLTGQGRIIVNFYRNGSFAGRTLSESDGYFSFLGLAPGTYTAAIDSAQLTKLKMKTGPAIAFNIALLSEGDVISDLNFKLQKNSPGLPGTIEPGSPVIALQSLLQVPQAVVKQTVPAISPGVYAPEVPQISKSNNMVTTLKPADDPGAGTTVNHEASLKTGTGSNVLMESGFSIRINGFGNSGQALSLQKKLINQYGHMVKIYFEGNNSYQLRLGGFPERAAAVAMLPKLQAHGLKNAIIESPRDLVPAISLAATTNDNNIRYRVVTGRIPDEAAVKQIQYLIRKNLGMASYPVGDPGNLSLQITGFKEKGSAETARKKLTQLGLKDGYVSSYKEKFVKIEEQPATAEPTTLYRLITGHLTGDADIRKANALIKKVLNRAAYPTKDGTSFRLIVSGFKTESDAAQANQKLISAGLANGYIGSYQQQEVNIHDRK
jgi:hypothetical protein